MANTLQSPKVRAVLDRLFAAAALDDETEARLPQRPTASATTEELAQAWEGIYMPISPEGGALLYSLIRASRPETVVEFGMSYGISTLHLAAGVANELGGALRARDILVVGDRDARLLPRERERDSTTDAGR